MYCPSCFKQGLHVPRVTYSQYSPIYWYDFKDFHAPFPHSLHGILRPQRPDIGAKTRRFYTVSVGARDAGLHGRERMVHTQTAAASA